LFIYYFLKKKIYILIGASLPLTGSLKFFSESFRNGLLASIYEINYYGGIFNNSIILDV